MSTNQKVTDHIAAGEVDGTDATTDGCAVGVADAPNGAHTRDAARVDGSHHVHVR